MERNGGTKQPADPQAFDCLEYDGKDIKNIAAQYPKLSRFEQSSSGLSALPAEASQTVSQLK